MQPATSRPVWRRYVAVGDSFTEGLSDPDPDRPGEYRGWADRLAGHLAAAADGEVEYANLAIRGRLVAQVLDEQLPVALRARPDLVSLVAGGNDLLRPGGDPDALAAALDGAVGELRSAGADVLLATGGRPAADADHPAHPRPGRRLQRPRLVDRRAARRRRPRPVGRGVGAGPADVGHRPHPPRRPRPTAAAGAASSPERPVPLVLPRP